MKLQDIIEFRAVPVVGPDASRPTPSASVQKYGVINEPLPHQYCKDRDWCEQKEKKKKKSKRLQDLEQGIDNATPRPY